MRLWLAISAACVAAFVAGIVVAFSVGLVAHDKSPGRDHAPASYFDNGSRDGYFAKP